VPSEATNEATRREWRELGYYYERDDERREWILVGSRASLTGFAQCVRAFASDPKNAGISEHDHLGPYMYLEIGTWNEPQITDHWIAGPPADMLRLAVLIEHQLASSIVGQCITLRSKFAPGSPYELRMKVKDESFDPAAADSNCW
jgi:hypothetical protein